MMTSSSSGIMVISYFPPSIVPEALSAGRLEKYVKFSLLDVHDASAAMRQNAIISLVAFIFFVLPVKNSVRYIIINEHYALILPMRANIDKNVEQSRRSGL